MPQVIGILREEAPLERRVAGTPDTVGRLQKLGFSVIAEVGAGLAAGFPDGAYAAAGAALADRGAVLAQADVVLRVRAPAIDEIGRMKRGTVLIAFIYPAQNKPLLDALCNAGVTAIAMDCIPRITRAQKMDALSSMGNLAGYRAVVEAAHAFTRPFAGQITAAGKVPPAKVLIIGAGVAGLAAVGAARGLGAIVRAFDTRPVVREQVQSMGAEFIEVTLTEDGAGEGGYAKEMSQAFIDAEMALFAEQAKDVDIIITTALIPGKPAPKLITRAMLDLMKPGSVVVDLAAEQGGNCEATEKGARVDAPTANGHVVVLGYTDLPSRMAQQASQLYGTNLAHLLDDMSAQKDGARSFRVDFADEVVQKATVVKDGQLTWPPEKRDPPAVALVPPPVSGAPVPVKAYPAEGAVVVALPAHPAKRPAHTSHAPVGLPSNTALLVSGALLLLVGAAAPPAFLSHLIVFVLACFIGFQVIWNVKPALHTPLMSVTNAISGIILVGGLLHANAGFAHFPAATALGALAILVAMINVAGGFLVTQRMLKMFRRGDGGAR